MAEIITVSSLIILVFVLGFTKGYRRTNGMYNRFKGASEVWNNIWRKRIK